MNIRKRKVERLVDGIRSAFDSVLDEEDIVEKGQATYSLGVKQWAVAGKRFLPSGSTVRVLPAGWYRLVYHQGAGPVPELMDIRNDELIKLPIPEYDEVLDDIARFWKSDAKYREFKFPYKRGILLYGHAGTGKSGLVRLLADDLVKNRDGIVISLGGPEDIHSFEAVFSVFRELEPKREVLCIIEDVDNFVSYGGSAYAKLLNVLDGNMRFDGVVFLATTNFPDRLLDSLANRPSRFDRRYEIGTPDSDARRVYIETKFPTIGEADVDNLVAVTENFTIDGIKELMLSVYALGYKLEEVVEDLKKLFIYRGRIGENIVSRGKSDAGDSIRDSVVYGYRDEVDKDLNR